MKGYLLRRTLTKCIHTFEAEPVVECGDCGGSRKVATYHNPSSLARSERKLFYRRKCRCICKAFVVVGAVWISFTNVQIISKN